MPTCGAHRYVLVGQALKHQESQLGARVEPALLGYPSKQPRRGPSLNPHRARAPHLSRSPVTKALRHSGPVGAHLHTHATL